MRSGEFDAARDFFEQSRVTYLALGDTTAARMSTVFSAQAFVELGEFARASDVLEALGQEAEVGVDELTMVGCLLGLADVAMSRGDFHRARHFLRTASQRTEASGMGTLGWRAQLGDAEVSLALEGILAFDQAMEKLSPPVGATFREVDQAVYMGLRALSEVYKGNLGVGTTDGADAVRRLVNSGRPSVALRLLRWLSERFEDLGEYELAIQFADQAATISEAVGNSPATLFTKRRLSRLFVKSDRPAEAIEVLESAIGVAQKFGRLEVLESLLHEALFIERALGYSRLIVHRLVRLAEVTLPLHGAELYLVYLMEALAVAVDSQVQEPAQIAERVVEHVTGVTLAKMDDPSLLKFAKNLGLAEQFEVAQSFVMGRAQRYAASNEERRAAELAAEFAEIALQLGRSSATESAYAMAIVLGDRLGLFEAEAWRHRLDFVVYG
jgi:tetratricopeptide (TPR) repeat protein